VLPTRRPMAHYTVSPHIVTEMKMSKVYT